MAAYYDIIRDSQTQAPLAGAIITVLNSAGVLANMTDAAGNAIPQPIKLGDLGILSFNIADPGDTLTIQYRVGGRLVREDNQVVGQPPQYKGNPGGTIGTAGAFAALSSLTVPANTQSLVIDNGQLRQDATLSDAKIAANPRAMGKSADGQRFRFDERYRINVDQYYQATDATWTPAINAVVAYLKALASDPTAGYSPTVNFLMHDYNLAGTLELHQQVRFFGETRGRENVAGTRLLLPASTQGLIVGRENSTGVAGSNSGGMGSAEGSIFQGLAFVSAGGVNTTSYGESGAMVRATCQFIDCVFSYFPNFGVAVAANDDPTMPPFGNANEVSLTNCAVSHNGNDGVYISGNNVNCFRAAGLFAGYNGGWGYNNQTSQPATFTGGHIVSNGKYGSGLGQQKTAVVFYQGRMWHVYPGKAATCSTTAPPTDTNNTGNWTYIQDMAAATGDIPTWTSGISLRDGGAAYMMASGGTHIGAYTEGSQGTFIYDPTTLLSGNFGSGKRQRIL